MKKIILFLIVTLLINGINGDAFAAITPSQASENIVQQIEDLKSKIASKVAELNLVEKRGVIGIVSDISDTQITLKDLNSNIRLIDVDELTKFSSSSKSFGISDIEKGARLGVLGLYNKQSRRILARDVRVLPPFPKVVYGIISFIDKINFELTITKKNGQKEVLEIEVTTKTDSYSNGTLVRSGFSKIVENQTILALGNPDKLNPQKTVASKIIILTNIDLSSTINPLSPSNQIFFPSTSSGVKLSPSAK